MPPDHVSGAARFHAVLAAVVRYLVRYPDAKDTEKGIVEWWRPASEAPWSLDEVRAVLEFLSVRRWVTVREVGDDERLYGINTERLAEMKSFLARVQDGRNAYEEE